MSSDEAMPGFSGPRVTFTTFSPYHIRVALRPPFHYMFPLTLAVCRSGNLQCLQAPLPGGMEMSLARAGLPRGYWDISPHAHMVAQP